MTRDYERDGRPLSPTLSRIILVAEEENRQILSIDDFKQFYGISDRYAAKMAAKLIEDGWLLRVKRGRFQLQPARTGLDPFPMGDKFVVAGQYTPDGFVAYGSAAEYHGLTTQVFPTVFVAVPTYRRRIDIGGTRLHFIRIPRGNFVGLQDLRKGPSVRVATLERTVIDAIDRSELCGGISDLPEILRRGRAKVNVARLLELLPSYCSKSLTQRVGYLLTSFGYNIESDQLAKLHELSEGSTAYLFPRRTAEGSGTKVFSREWNLIINSPGFSP